MKPKFKSALIGTAMMFAAVLCFAEVRSSKVLWLDFDMKNIPEPKERSTGYYDDFIKGQFIEEGKQVLDLPRWMRHAAGHPKQASNVNALDEVPDSSWYTNRHHIHRMNIVDLQRGPNKRGRISLAVLSQRPKRAASLRD